MIKEAVSAWEANKENIRSEFKKSHPSEYKDVMRIVIKNISDEDSGWNKFCPDFERIHEIDDGSCQGTLIYVVAEKGYQPSRYWYVRVSYGSCSGCDTLQSIHGYSDNAPTEEQVSQYMTLALHIVQGLKEMVGESV